jgi:hypothetical protein
MQIKYLKQYQTIVLNVPPSAYADFDHSACNNIIPRPVYFKQRTRRRQFFWTGVRHQQEFDQVLAYTRLMTVHDVHDGSY